MGENASTAADLTAAGIDSTLTDGANGEIASESVTGDWNATLHGSNNQITDFDADRVKYPKTRYPTADLAGLAGWFEASGTNAAIAGAFGASCATGPCAK